MTIHPSGTPSEAMIELMAPDGYYRYLDIKKGEVLVAAPSSTSPASSSSSAGSSSTTSGGGAGGGNAEHTPLTDSTNAATTIDEDMVKKNYRKLSRKHHPDRPGGDADTFRLLNRAYRVLLNPKLRHQYDILGVDLDDDEVEDDRDNEDHDLDGDNANANKGGGAAGGGHKSSAQGIIQEIASMVLSSIMQLAVRTAMMAAVAVLLVRYRILLYPTLAFLSFIAYRIFQQTQQQQQEAHATVGGGITLEFLSPLIICAGLLSMHNGRTVPDGEWTYYFWIGEATVIAMFTYNSASALPTKTPLVLLSIVLFSLLSALWFRGKGWNYVLVIGLEVFLAIVVALAFPIVEIILDSILNEKLRKVGDKVRVHHEVLESYYKSKLEKLKQEQEKPSSPSPSSSRRK